MKNFKEMEKKIKPMLYKEVRIIYTGYKKPLAVIKGRLKPKRKEQPIISSCFDLYVHSRKMIRKIKSSQIKSIGVLNV